MSASALRSPRGLILVARPDAHAGRLLLERLEALLEAVEEPIALVLLGPLPALGPEDALPERVEIVVAEGEIAEVLEAGEDDADAREALGALVDMARQELPEAPLWFIGSPTTLGLLPALSALSWPAALVLELPEGVEAPEAAEAWRLVDGLVVSEAERVYGLSSGRPALPVRHVPRGVGRETLAAMRSLPLLGGAPRVSVVVPVRGQGPYVERMARSVLENTEGLLELVLVDDASDPATRRTLERLSYRDARVRLFEHDEQRGFAATTNEGLAAARGEVVVVLNGDTVVPRGWAGRLLPHLSGQRLAGVAAPLSNYVAGLQQIAPVAYDTRSLNGLDAFAARLGEERRGYARASTQVKGLCMAISRRALRRVGGFDPRFFPGNYEDDDWCLRLLSSGLFPYVADDSFVHHEGSKSFDLEPRGYREILEENWARFKAKWNIDPERPISRGYSIEEIALLPFDEARFFIAPWEALTPAR